MASAASSTTTTSRTTATATTTTKNCPPLVTVRIRPTGPNCPIGFHPKSTTDSTTNINIDEKDDNDDDNIISFSIVRGGCIWLDGPSGRGKTTIAKSIVPELYQQQKKILHKLHLDVQCEWYNINNNVGPQKNESLPNVGILFQQSTLIDELSVAGNLALAIQCNNNKNHHPNPNSCSSSSSNSNVQSQMKSVMDMVGLHYYTDIQKRCYELSGGMARRVSLAIQLLQQKHIIILDEPFTGLDHSTAISIAKELVRLRNAPYYIAFVLITHEPELARIVLNESSNSTTIGNVIVPLPEPSIPTTNAPSSHVQHPYSLNTSGIYMYDRFCHRLYDYIVYSILLIVCTFIATGMAISMISADALQRIQIHEPIQQLIDSEIRPLITMITGEATINPLYMIGIKMKVNQMLQTTIPTAKMNIYTIGMIQLFVLEIGPLLTGLLLAGRIGGSYAGNIITMITTSQIHLLRTMGISTNIWLFYPTLGAAWIAGPILTFVGTSIALFCTSIIGVRYQIVSSIYDFWNTAYMTILPPLRLQGIVMSRQLLEEQSKTPNITTTTIKNIFELDYYRTTYSPNNWYETLIEIITYPFLFAIIKSIVFISIIICTAEVCTRYYNNYYYYYSHPTQQPNHRKTSIFRRQQQQQSRQHHALTHRDVPNVITTSVVMASLAIILADWGFSRIWLQRH